MIDIYIKENENLHLVKRELIKECYHLQQECFTKDGLIFELEKENNKLKDDLLENVTNESLRNKAKYLEEQYIEMRNLLAKIEDYLMSNVNTSISFNVIGTGKFQKEIMEILK